MNCSVRNDRNPSKAQADSPATGHDLSRLRVARNHSTFIALPCAVYGRINILRAGVLILLAVVGGGCATFHLTQEPFAPKGKTLTVISGLTNAGSLTVAQALGDEVGKGSRCNVWFASSPRRLMP